MKAILTFFLFSYSHLMAFAAGGFFDSFAYVNVNGSGNTYYDLSATTGNPDFLSANLGNIIQGQSLMLGGQTKTFKNNSTDVTGVAIFYRYYIGSPSGTFTQINYAFQFNLANPGDQQWGTDISGSNPNELSINILPASPAVGTYTLEVYVVVFTNGTNANPEIYDNNMGSNYQATFTVEAPLNASILQFSAIEKQSKVHLTAAIDYTEPLLNASFHKLSEVDYGKADWNEIATIDAQEIEHYLQHIDYDLNHGAHYYRLAITEMDGSVSYSNVQKVWIKNNLQIVVHPNPFVNILNIRGLDSDIEINVIITDMLGRIVYERKSSDHHSIHDVSTLVQGMYTIQVLDKGNKILHQQLIMK